MKNYPTLELKQNKDKSLKRRHPWIFSGALLSQTSNLNDGDKVHIVNEKRNIIATGHFSPGSIAIRVLAFEKVELNAAFYKTRIENAYNVRKKVGLIGATDTNAYRLVHAGGDQLAGLVIDIYNNVAVVQAHSRGMENDFDCIASALKDLYGDSLASIKLKSAEKNSSVNLNPGEGSVVDIIEHGCTFRINYETGQKTGFFLDQRENRQLIQRYAQNRKVLNAYSYSGGFSIYALRAAAAEVHSLDSSEKAIDLVAENLALNSLDNARHKSLCTDALAYLNSAEAAAENYDLIVLDPPAFARRRSARHKAVQAYKRLNARALQLIQPGGILFTFSCSQVVNTELFYKTIAAAAMESGRPVRILQHLHQPADHPVSIYHPEGEYLKGLVLAVD